jgi:hypothetical protein
LLPSGPGGVFDLASRGADGATIDVRQRRFETETGGERGIRLNLRHTSLPARPQTGHVSCFVSRHSS